MNIVDEGSEVFAIRVDHNQGAYSKYHIKQTFHREGLKVVEISQDFDQLNLHNNTVFKIYAEDSNGIKFEWQRLIEPKNAVVTYKHPSKSEVEMINEFYESIRDEFDS